MDSNQRPFDRLPSHAVVEAVAVREGLDIFELDVPLFDSIDPDALDSLLGARGNREGSSVRVQFRYYGYDVTATSTGDVRLQ